MGFTVALTLFTLFAAETMKGTLVIVMIVTLPTVAWIGAQMLRNARLNEQLQVLVDRDRLTNVATRDFFFARMEAEPDAYGVSLMIDIDRFKRINDSFGHLAGDKVIQAVAAALLEHTRAEDVVCRFGGEEFIVFLQDRNIEDGYAAAERLRNAIAATLVRCDGRDLTVTVSIGGSLKDRIADINHVIRLADDALFQAKQSGRNRTNFIDRSDTEHAKAS